MKAKLIGLLERAGSTALATLIGLLTTLDLTNLTALNAAAAAAIAASLSVIINGLVAIYATSKLNPWVDALVRVALTFGQSFVAILVVSPNSWSSWQTAAVAAWPTVLSAIKVIAATELTGTPAAFTAKPEAPTRIVPAPRDTAKIAEQINAGTLSVAEVRASVFASGPAQVTYPRSLGLRKPTRARATLQLATYLTGIVPDHPLSIDNTGHVGYGLDGNDQFGVCVPTGYDNLRRTTTTNLLGQTLVASQAQVFSWYRTQNPNFDPTTGADDNGMEIQTFLEYLVKTGEILGFAAVDPANAAEVDAALYLFLGVLYGVDLETAQQAQTSSGVWDYQRSGVWGGHCVVGVAYESDGQDVITWAERVRMTPGFVQHQAQQAFVVIRPEHIAHPGFRAGVDLQALAADYRTLTGKPFPADIPPAPVPPTPTPAPPTVVTEYDRALWAQLLPWATARHEGKNHTAAVEFLAWGHGLGLS